MEKAVVIGDLHIPFHSKEALKLTLDFMKLFKPDKIFICGDFLDCWDISDFVRPLHIVERFCDEIEEANYVLDQLQEITKDITYIFGNHEFRLEKYISKNARELYGLKGLTIEEQLRLKERGIKAVNSHLRENYVRYGELLIGHFNKVSMHSAYTAKALLEKFGISLIQGHTHRGGSHFKRGEDGIKVAYENFCLCDLEPKYCLKPNWTQGFSTIHRNKKGRRFFVTQVPIFNNKLMYGDDLIEYKN